MAKKKKSAFKVGDPIGRKILRIRPMTLCEAESNGWDFGSRHGPPAVIELEGGMTLYASRDPEGNGPGALVGVDEVGNQLGFYPGEA